MKKTLVFSLAGVMALSGANAGLLSNLFSKDKEPQTLEEACNKDEITAICPDVILGDQTIQDCLIDNVTKLSTKCAKFVKKTATEKIDAVKQQVADIKSGAQDMSEEQKAAAAAKKEAAKAARADFKKSLKETKDAAKAALAAEKAQFTNGVAPTTTDK